MFRLRAFHHHYLWAWAVHLLRYTSEDNSLSSFITLLSSYGRADGVWLWYKPQQYNFHDTTTSNSHLVAPVFHDNTCPTSSESLLILRYSHMQNLHALQKYTIARNRAVWEFYVICASDIQPKFAGSSSVTHAFERHKDRRSFYLLQANSRMDTMKSVLSILLLCIRIPHFWLWPRRKK
jgi:hypothetical protein